MNTQNIRMGSFVKWEPKDLNKKFCNKTAITLRESLPLLGLMKDISGQAGIMSYLKSDRKKGEITVLLDELKLAGVPCAE